jgi:hypothetical protein
MTRLRVTRVQIIEVCEDLIELDDFRDSYASTLLDEQDSICETSDDAKFNYIHRELIELRFEADRQ